MVKKMKGPKWSGKNFRIMATMMVNEDEWGVCGDNYL